jgi:hypothetical protein
VSQKWQSVERNCHTVTNIELVRLFGSRSSNIVLFALP